MSKQALPSEVQRALSQVGEQVRIARKRRKLSEGALARLALVSRDTVRRVEAGDPGVTMAVLGSILWALRLDEDLVLIADPARDAHGMALHNATLPNRIRSSRDEQLDF